MDPIENPVEVPASEDNGNVPAEAPSQAPQLQPLAVDETPDGNTPATQVESVPQTVAPEELFETPDGRKVDAATLAREWKENFLPDYTRKSQALAAQNKQQTPENISNQPADKYADPNYVPQSYAEIIEAAEQRAIAKFEEKQQSEIQRVSAIEAQVTTQLTELKTVDPSLNENALFLHATKYGFQDLKSAYTNMKDMATMAKNVQQQTAQNIQRRATEPVAAQPGQNNGTTPDPSQFATARDYVRSLNK